MYSYKQTLKQIIYVYIGLYAYVGIGLYARVGVG